VVQIQVPRGLILHHLSRPAGASPPGFICSQFTVSAL
jgi:hypothetical protein